MKKNQKIICGAICACLICSVHVSAQIITTIAGNGTGGGTGDGGAATAARLNIPKGVAVDGSGNVYIADWENYLIRVVNSGGIINEYAGTGCATCGCTGDGGNATAATFDLPTGVAVDGSGNVYIADDLDNRIRKVNSGGTISTFAGTGCATCTPIGNGVAATTAYLNQPNGVAVASDGSGGVNVYIADFNHNMVRVVNNSGTISRIAGTATGTPGYSSSDDGGNATAAKLDHPTGVAVASDGSGGINIFIADQYNSRIRIVNNSGIINTYAGTGCATCTVVDNVAATASPINTPSGVAVDGSGNVYIADAGNHRIRIVNSSGIINTYAGTGCATCATGDGGAATAASLTCFGIAVDDSGSLYIADDGKYRVRKVGLPAITGGSMTVCGGASISLSNTVAGGTWSCTSSNATVGSSTGVVTGVSTITAVGTAVVTYTVGGCFVTATVTVNPLPAAIGGTAAVCTSSTITLTDAVTGGTWSSSATGTAIVGSSTGIVTGVAAGTATISYTNGCGSATIAITVATTGTITGTTGAVCIGSDICLTATGTTGGTWSSSATSVATVNATGIVTGQGTTTGTATITYSAISGCYATYPVTASVCGITTFAGGGASLGDGGAATSAQLTNPSSVAIDAIGNIYIADMLQNRIRKINTSGVISTIAGNGTFGYSGDGGQATDAKIPNPKGVVVDGSGNIYIVGGVVRKVNTSGIISTFAGSDGSSCYSGYCGDGGPATAATLQDPWGLAIDGSGNVLIADSYNNVIRKVNSLGIISTIAGNGTQGYFGDGGQATNAELNVPLRIITDNAGNIYFSDLGNNIVRKINSSGIISTIAGTANTPGYTGDGAAATAATMYWPSGLAFDCAGNLYIGDDSDFVVRKVTPAGIISTIAGNNIYGYSGDDGPAIAAEFSEILDVAIDASGNAYIPDLENQVVRIVGPELCTGCRIGNGGNPAANGVHGVLSNHYTLYPNPTTGKVAIMQSMEYDCSATVRVMNLMGQVVHSGRIVFGGGKSEVELGDVPEGMYIVEVKDSEGVGENFKLVVGR